MASGEEVKTEHFDGLEDLVGDDEKLQELLAKLLEVGNNNNQQGAARSGQFIEIHWTVYIVAFAIIFGVIGLFSYKLVKSLQEKERKREEKKKLKEMKKKK